MNEQGNKSSNEAVNEWGNLTDTETGDVHNVRPAHGLDHAFFGVARFPGYRYFVSDKGEFFVQPE